MNYFLVNHDFHINYILNQAQNIDLENVTLIVVNYQVLSDKINKFRNVINLETPNRSLKKFFNPFYFRTCLKEVENIRFKKEDNLIFYTEYDPINNAVVYSAKMSGATTILHEEGVATYLMLKYKSSELLSIKDKIKILYTRYLIGMKYMTFYRLEGFYSYKLDDQFIDIALLYNTLTTERMLEIFTIDNGLSKIQHVGRKNILFLSQPIYQQYVTKEYYIEDILKKLVHLAKDYRVHIKFHPRDELDVVQLITDKLKDVKNVIFLKNNISVVECAHTYEVSSAYSYFSNGLFELEQVGVKVNFMFFYTDKLMRDDTLDNLKTLLKILQYKPAKNIEDSNFGFVSKEKQETISISDVLDRVF